MFILCSTTFSSSSAITMVTVHGASGAFQFECSRETSDCDSQIAQTFRVVVGSLVLGLFCTIWVRVACGLSWDYYVRSCPFAEMTVRDTVSTALQTDPTLSAPLLRMHFHDCFVEGCDGSILIDSTDDNKAEKDSPANLILRGYEVIDDAKQRLEEMCPGAVSCADILAMAARDAVLLSGGPMYDIPKGRKDGSRSKIEDTRNLPPATFNASALIKLFAKHGLTAQEMVALSGGHTLGVARCASIENRLKHFDSTHEVDPTINFQLLFTLRRTCLPNPTSDQVKENATVPFDQTQTRFDNAYFVGLVSSAGILTSDQTLTSHFSTRDVVNTYAMNQAAFFFDFSQAMIKMGLIEVKDDDEGDVRLNCRQLNTL